MTVIRVTTEEELRKHATGGTLNCGLGALKQGKPVYVGIPSGDNEADAEYLLREIMKNEMTDSKSRSEQTNLI